MPNFLPEAYKNKWPDIREAAELDPNFKPEEHFLQTGRNEGRHISTEIKANIEQSYFTKDGYLFIHGWLFDLDSRENALSEPDFSFSIDSSFYSTKISKNSVLRYYREDVCLSHNSDKGIEYGFIIFCKLDLPVSVSESMKLNIRYKQSEVPFGLDFVSNPRSYNEVINQYFKILDFIKHSSKGISACVSAYEAHGKEVISCWQKGLTFSLKHKVIKGSNTASKPLFSIVTIVYGTVELLPTQFNLMFSEAAKFGAEIIIGCNSPEIAEKTIEICRYAEKLYNIPYTLVVMNGNAGFSGANNVAAKYANSKVLLFVNPDIFPSSKTNWSSLLKCINQLDDDTIFAPFLQYSDGSVMHSGMKVFVDKLPGNTNTKEDESILLRVDHPAEGLLSEAIPATTEQIKVEAVTGGFLICSANLYDRMGGFGTDFVYGHYEDADFCLRAKSKGVNIYCLSNLYFVHLEGKGSKNLDKLASSGSSLFNRCHFSKRFSEYYRK